MYNKVVKHTTKHTTVKRGHSMSFKKFFILALVIVQTFTLVACNQEVDNTSEQQISQEINQTYDYDEQHLSVNNDGREVPFVFTAPKGMSKYPLVVMYHGFGGSKDEGAGFVRISKALAAKGIATVRMDFAGCGESKAPFMEFNLKNNISDGNACMNYVLENNPVDQEQIGLLGYSMGGATAVLETSDGNSSYKALVLLAPGTATNQEWIDEVNNNMTIAHEKGFFKLDWFGQELHVSEDYYKILNDSFDVFRKYDNPVDCILIYGDQDQIVLPEYSIAFAKQLDVEAIEIKNADHGYGFYSDEPDVSKKLESTISEFFNIKLKK